MLALLLGTLAFAALGLALTGYIRSAEGSSAVVNAIYLPAAFLSGSFWSPHAYPRFLEIIADVLPLDLLHPADARHRCSATRRSGRAGSRPPSSPRGASRGSSLAIRDFRWEPRES